MSKENFSAFEKDASYPEYEEGPNRDVPEVYAPKPQQADELPKQPPETPPEDKPREVIEIEAAPGVYEVYDKQTGELVDISINEEEA